MTSLISGNLSKIRVYNFAFALGKANLSKNFFQFILMVSRRYFNFSYLQNSSLFFIGLQQMITQLVYM